MIRNTLNDALEQIARGTVLPGLQITERQIDPGRDLVRTRANQIFVDLDRARVETQAEVHDAKQPLALDITWLHAEGSLELLLGFRNAIVLKQLAAAVQVKQEVFTVEIDGGRRLG